MTSLLPDEGEYLTTGWEPDLEAADTVVRQAVVAHASWAVARASCLGRRFADGPMWAAGHAADRGATTNWVVVKQPGLDLAQVVGDVDDLIPPSAPQ